MTASLPLLHYLSQCLQSTTPVEKEQPNAMADKNQDQIFPDREDEESAVLVLVVCLHKEKSSSECNRLKSHVRDKGCTVYHEGFERNEFW
jgi:hypothetical protein